MAIVISNTNYNGEVLETLLSLAATGNELVERGLIRMEPGVTKKFSIPRIKGGTMLQKRIEQPGESNTKGDFVYSERSLEPKEFMAFTTFNPRSFESIWRPFQPKGSLVFSQLTPEGQNALLAELAKCVTFELGDHLINGTYGTGESQLFNGYIYRMMNDTDKVVVDPYGCDTMVQRLKAVWKKIPKTMRNNPGLRFIMSTTDCDAYDDELTAAEFKGSNWTDTNVARFKGIGIEALAQWPDGVIVATITGEGIGTNMWAACNLVDDDEVVQIDKLSAAGEKYFFKMMMSMDTNTAFGEEVVWLDCRGISVEKTSIAFPAAGGDINVKVFAAGTYTATASDGFTVVKTATGIKVTAANNSSGSAALTGTVTLALDDDATVTKTISITQPKA